MPKSRTVIKVKKVRVDEGFDWCMWQDKKKTTLTYIRRAAQLNGEPDALTKIKLDAVRAQEPEMGTSVVYSYDDHGIKRWGAVSIRLMNKRTIERLLKR